MGLVNTIKELFSSKSITVGELDKAANLKIEKRSESILVDSIDDIKVTNEYRFVKHLIENGFPIIFVSGKAGTGKSTLIRYLRFSLNKNVVVVAPTGVAALNVRGATINSYFRFPPRIIVDDDIQKVRDRRLYINLDLLVIDEISMVRAEIIDAIDKFLRLNGKKNSLPFGGVQLLFIGDLFQIPPVVKPDEERVLSSLGYSSPYFFSSKSLLNCKLVPIELVEIFRQKDPEFTSILNKVRIAEDIKSILPILNSRLNKEYNIDKKIFITLTCTNPDADRINDYELSKLNGMSKTFVGEANGKFTIEDVRLPSPMNLTLKVDSQVMFTKNGTNWVNGTLGKVVSFKRNSIQVQILSNNIVQIVDVGIAKWESYAYKFDTIDNKIKPFVTGEFQQYPLMPAWAITIHKSQGKTLENINIDIGNGAFTTGQIYVALSRTRAFEDISLSKKINETDIKCDERIKRFYLAISNLMNKFSKYIDHPELKNLKLPDDKCPYCWNELVKRNGNNENFLGCSNYPKCTYTRNNQLI